MKSTPEFDRLIDRLFDADKANPFLSQMEEPEPEPRNLGGPGSGNFGHAGRPGQVGGSADADGDGGAILDRADFAVRREGVRLYQDQRVKIGGKAGKVVEVSPADNGGIDYAIEMEDGESGVLNSRRGYDITVDAPGITGLGGPGSGNFGHAGRPGQVGGSAPASGSWQSAGGWEHTGIDWKQPVDEKTGRPIPIKVKTVEEACELVLDGKVVEVEDARTAHTLIDTLAQRALEAKKAGKEAKDYDLCQVTVAGSSMFCAEGLRTPQFPNGVPRLEMPQLGGKPVPGSEADKLPRNPWDPSEVDGSEKFISHLQGIGITTKREVIPAANLRASQRELVGSKVGAMMRDKSFDPAKNPIFISSDNYVVDGHHRWAAVLGRDFEDGKIGDTTMNTIRVNAPISEVLHIANAWSAKFGIQQAAGVVRQANATGLVKKGGK